MLYNKINNIVSLNYFNILIVLALITVEALAETCLKYASISKPMWGISNKNVMLFIGLILYIFVAYLFYTFLRNFTGSFALANIIWQISNILIVTTISLIVFKTKMTRLQWLGYILLIIGLLLSSLDKPMNEYSFTL